MRAERREVMRERMAFLQGGSVPGRSRPERYTPGCKPAPRTTKTTMNPATGHDRRRHDRRHRALAAPVGEQIPDRCRRGRLRRDRASCSRYCTPIYRRRGGRYAGRGVRPWRLGLEPRRARSAGSRASRASTSATGGVAGQEAQAVLESRRLLEEFIRRNDLVDVLVPPGSEQSTVWYAARSSATRSSRSPRTTSTARRQSRSNGRIPRSRRAGPTASSRSPTS